MYINNNKNNILDDPLNSWSIHISAFRKLLHFWLNYENVVFGQHMYVIINVSKITFLPSWLLKGWMNQKVMKCCSFGRSNNMLAHSNCMHYRIKIFIFLVPFYDSHYTTVWWSPLRHIAHYICPEKWTLIIVKPPGFHFVISSFGSKKSHRRLMGFILSLIGGSSGRIIANGFFLEPAY